MRCSLFSFRLTGGLWVWSHAQHEMLRHESRDVAYAATNDFYMEALSMLSHNYPWWNRTQGRDHIFVFPGVSAAFP